jgi:hypothetical protein
MKLIFVASIQFATINSPIDAVKFSNKIQLFPNQHVHLAHVLMRLCSIDKSFACLQSERMTSCCTLARSGLCKGVYNLIEVILNEPSKSFRSILNINSNLFCYDIEKYIYFFKIRQIIGNIFK